MNNMTRALGYMQLLLEKRQLNPTVDQDFVLRRIATKVWRASERIGFVPASGTLLVLRCNGRVVYKESSPAKKEYVN